MSYQVTIGNSCGVSYINTFDILYIRKLIAYYKNMAGYRIRVYERHGSELRAVKGDL